MPRVRATADPFDVIRRLRYATDEVAVGFSCGKDSCVVADLCLTWFNRVSLFYLYYLPDLSFHEAYLEHWKRRAGHKLALGEIIRLPHWALSHDLKMSAFRPFSVENSELPKLRLRDTEVEVARRTGIRFFAYGQKKADSLERRAMLNRCNGVMLESNRAFPLAEWSNRSVTQYMRDHAIPLSPEYEHFGCSYGGQLEGKYLVTLAKHYPADYARLLEKFPFADAERYRYELMGADKGDRKKVKARKKQA